MYCLKMYVASQSPATQALSRGINLFLEKRTGGQFKLEVINVLDSPDRAVADNVMATPTLIRETPLPSVRLTGNFNDVDAVFHRLGLDCVEASI